MTASQLVGVLKAGTGLLGALLLLWDILGFARLSRPRADFLRRSFVALGLVGVCAWFNFGSFHFGQYVHRHELFHYYLGAKYQKELGYTRLYHCVAVAEAQDGRVGEVARRWMRNLDTNVIERGAVALQQADFCRDRFSDARWEAFRRDVEWFRAQSDASYWEQIQMDHGYNATPVWTMTGTTLANLGPASWPLIRTLALLDPLLLVGLFAVVWRVFGWKAAAVSAVWWGTNYPARFYWTGGAFLRADWLFLMVLSVCFAYRRQMFWSGAALAGAAALRVFPGFMAVGLVIHETARMWKERTVRPSAGFMSFAGGAAAGMALLLVASSVVNSGRLLDIEAWEGFVDNSRKHLSTPATNMIGLRFVLAFDPDSTVTETQDVWVDAPWDAWQEARRRTFERREPWFWAGLALMLGLLTRAAARGEPWKALVLGIGVLPFAVELSCYYYAFLLLYGLLVNDSPWPGVALCLLSSLTWVPPAFLEMMDEIYFAVSALVVFFVLAVTGFAAFRPAMPMPETARPWWNFRYAGSSKV